VQLSLRTTNEYGSSGSRKTISTTTSSGKAAPEDILSCISQGVDMFILDKHLLWAMFFRGSWFVDSSAGFLTCHSNFKHIGSTKLSIVTHPLTSTHIPSINPKHQTTATWSRTLLRLLRRSLSPPLRLLRRNPLPRVGRIAVPSSPAGTTTVSIIIYVIIIYFIIIYVIIIYFNIIYVIIIYVINHLLTIHSRHQVSRSRRHIPHPCRPLPIEQGFP
jgi:hypothetical protein